MYYFFDMDGTICDSGEGIIKGIEMAFSMLHLPLPKREELVQYIGPPLYDSFVHRAHLSHIEAEMAIKVFRDYYMRKGKFENKLYEGMVEVLEAAKEKRSLAIATSKPEFMAKDIANKFQISQYFDMVAGASYDGRRTAKIDVISYAMEELKIQAKEIIMVGDRYTDVEAAKKLGIQSVGVLYGYGTREELERCGADYIVKDTPELAHLVKQL